MQSVKSNRSNVLTLGSLDIAPSLTQHVSFIAALTYVIILTCNITMVLVIALNKHLHKPMYVLLLNLHITDMIGTSAVFPQLIHSIRTQSNTISYQACYLQSLLIHLHCDGTHLILTVMAFDRYLAICRPLRYHAIMTGVNLRRIIAFVWLTDWFLVGTLFLMQMRLQQCHWRLSELHCTNASLVKLSCGNIGANKIYALVITVLIHGGTIAVVLFTYGHILVTCIITREVDARTKALRTCGTHLVVFLVFELVVLFYILSHRMPVSSNMRRALIDTVMVISPILNPLIYGLNTKEIRNTISHVFLRKKNTKVFREP